MVENPLEVYREFDTVSEFVFINKMQVDVKFCLSIFKDDLITFASADEVNNRHIKTVGSG